MVTSLIDLPQFKILEISKFLKYHDLFGVLNKVPELGNGALWLYNPGHPFWGSMDSISPEAMTAKVWTQDWTPDCPVQIGTSWPLIDACWRLEFIESILDPACPFRRVHFEARDAQHFECDGRTGWGPAGQPLTEGATPLHIEPGGWDHEHCIICLQRIGVSGEACGFVDHEDQWLCESCFEKHAQPHDLSFVFPETSS